MITSGEIRRLFSKYDKSRLTISTICSHSALQIFHGAKWLKFKTLGVTTPDRRFVYEAFPLAKPDIFIEVREFKDILSKDVQERLVEENCVIIPHGSFVEYIGAANILNRLFVPMFGNRMVLLWESDRSKQREWFREAGLKTPREFKNPSEVDCKVFVKYPGAKGGTGYFIADSAEELEEKIKRAMEKRLIKSVEEASIQEFVPGVRYYFHFFYSLMLDVGFRVTKGRLELLGMDKRIEPIDEAYRGLPNVPEEFFDYTVTGNQPLILRESFLKDCLDMGARVVLASQRLFPPGIVGPFCLETIYHPSRGFTVFEVSARIVAGTNLYPQGSPYTAYLFNEPMSTGKRIALELKKALESNRLEEILY
ncbi:formate--phosphoribosylaminoimidazolecarboxamide ligase [Candidatus Bathyarchaeota archaeon]|nr:formate--phosphoribosylaminoimidazolecarboxamide ligase [Candidatus Bathyarchaeota archaeon]MBS7618030.1 formate--phosphoribosylaminoimidazolecarboxamide ligase [Candidatus Bathyarchaeota archaeon]